MLENLSLPQRAAVYIVMIVGGLFFWSYLSSTIFFSMVGLPESDIKPWSIFEYFQAYGHDQAILNKLGISAGIPPLL